MKKRILLLLIVMLAMLSFGGIANATPIDDLTSLADHYPEDTAFFAVIRTDAGYVETLDGVLSSVINALPEDLAGDLTGFSVADLLDLVAFTIAGTPYQGGVDEWIGASASIGVFDVEGIMDGVMMDSLNDIADVPFVVALEVTDGAPLIEALSANIAPEQITETDDYTMLEDDGFAVLISDELFLFGPTDTVMANFDGAENPLRISDNFTAAVNALPADNYNIFAYVDAQNILTPLVPLIEEMAAESGTSVDSVMGGLDAEDAGALALGFTVLDGRTLSIDFVTVQDLDMMMEQPGYVEQNAIDPTFAQYVPSNAQLVIHDNGFGTDALAVIEMLNAFGPLFQEQLEVMAEQTNEEIPLDLSAINFGEVLQLPLTIGFAGITGLNLEDEVLTWMTGDYATHISLIPVESDLGLSFDVGFVTTATDADAAANVISTLAESVEAYEVSNRLEDIGDGEALVIPGLIRSLFPSDLAEVVAETPELDILVGSDDNVFVVGSRPAVEAALNPTDTLADNPTFMYTADKILLDAPVSVWYISVPSIVEALPALQTLGAGGEDMQALATLMSVLESMTISSRFHDAGTITRLTLTIEDDASIPEFEMASELVPTQVILATPTATPTEEPSTETNETEAEDTEAVDAVEDVEVTPEAEMTEEPATEPEATEESGG